MLATLGVEIILPVTQGKVRAVGRWITLAAGIVGAIWFAAFLYTTFAFLHAPLQPDRASGNVIPWNNHGVVHYVTSFQDQVQNGLWSAVLIIMVVGFVGLALYRGRHMFDRR